MKKLTIGARIKSLLPTLSISLPAIITGILIFSERNLMDPLTSLFAKSEEKKDEKELAEEEGSKGEDKEKGEKDAKGKKKGKGKEDGKGTKGDGGDNSTSKGLDDKNKAGDSGEDGLKVSTAEGQVQNGSGEQAGAGSLELSLGQESEVHGTDHGNPLGNAEDNATGSENKDGQETEKSNVISAGDHNGEVEERKTRRLGGGSRQWGEAFSGFFGEINVDFD